MTKVGFVGLGQMGGPMSRNLINAGYGLRVFDVNADAIQALVSEGATGAASPADAAKGADFVFTMLPIGAIVEDAVFGTDGIADSLSAGALLIDMSTILPSDTQRIGARLAERGLSMIDAPVGRTSAAAVEGKSTFMVGGAEADIERARPLLDVLGESITHCGSLGTGAMMKLANNYITTVINIATAEGMALAEAGGISHETAREVMSLTPAGRSHLNTTWPHKAMKDDPAPDFMLDLAYKDMGLALETAAQLNVPLTTGAAGRQIYSVARAQGRGGNDWTTGIFRTIRSLAGLGG